MVLCGMWCHQQDCIQWWIQGVFVGYGQPPSPVPEPQGLLKLLRVLLLLSTRFQIS